MRTTTMGLTAVAGLVIVAGCGGIELDEPIEVPAGAAEIRAERVAYEQNSGIEDRRRVVIRTESEWRTFWNEVTQGMSPRPSRPAIDFGDEMIIAAAMGERRTGGHEIRIESVYRTTGAMVAVVEETRPASDCPVSQALTAPVDIVRVPATNRAVSFAERESVRECE